MITQTPLPIGAYIAPDYALLLQQKDVTETFRHRLLSLTLTENRGFSADQLTLELDDSDGQVIVPKRNQTLSLKLGWREQVLSDKGKFVVDEVRHQGAPDSLTIIARSVDFRGSMNVAHDRSYHNKTLGEIVAEIANRNRLGNTLAPGLAEIKIAHIDQTQETDAAFITRLASMNGAVASIKNERLLMLIPGKGQTASGQPIAPLILERSDGDKHLFNLADRKNYTGVQAKWLDAKNARQQRLTVQRKKNANDEQNAQSYLAGSSENIFIMPTIYANKGNAMQAAKARWESIQQGSVEFAIDLAIGRPELSPETPIQVRGFKEVIDQQDWIINTTTHTMNSSGYTTKIDLDVLSQRVEFAVEET